MHHLGLRIGFPISLLGLFCIAGAGQAVAQDKPEKAVIAVFDLQGVRTEPTTTIAASDRLRQELLKTGNFKPLSRQALDNKLSEQGIDQLTCLESNCALKVGQVMGARLVLTGRIIVIDSGTWQIFAEFTDVSTGEAIVAGSIIHQGNLVGLMAEGIPQLVDKLVPAGDAASYPDIVDFLLESRPAPSLAVGSGGSADEQGEPEPPVERNYRVWVSPFSIFTLEFNLDYEDPATGETKPEKFEKIEGSGTSAGLEFQISPLWAAGAVFHMGSLETVSSPVSGLPKRPIAGDYRSTSLLFMATIPRERPWFFVGWGLGYTTVDWNEAGVSGTDTVTSILAMARGAYTFDLGLSLGLDLQISLFGSSKGDRLNLIREQGAADPDVELTFISLFLGYSF